MYRGFMASIVYHGNPSHLGQDTSSAQHGPASMDALCLSKPKSKQLM